MATATEHGVCSASEECSQSGSDSGSVQQEQHSPMLVHSKAASISLGDIMEIVGMKKRFKLNGLIGKVVEERADATGRTYDVRIAGAGGRTHGVLRKVSGTHLSKVKDTSMLVSPMATATEHGASLQFPCSRERGDVLRQGQLALIFCSNLDGERQGKAVVQVRSKGNPYFPVVSFLAASNDDYQWYISAPGKKDRVPADPRLHLCKTCNDPCEVTGGKLQIEEHVYRWHPLTKSEAKKLAENWGREITFPEKIVPPVAEEEAEKDDTEDFEEEHEDEDDDDYSDGAEHGASSASATAEGTSAVTATELDPDNQTVDLVYDLMLFLSDVLADACTSSRASRSAHDECLDMVYEKCRMEQQQL